jgi:hypothetical protein
MSTSDIHQKTYQLYGRKTYSEPLRFINEIQVEQAEDINATVFTRIEKSDWLELVAFPSHAAIRVIPREDEP